MRIDISLKYKNFGYMEIPQDKTFYDNVNGKYTRKMTDNEKRWAQRYQDMSEKEASSKEIPLTGSISLERKTKILGRKKATGEELFCINGYPIGEPHPPVSNKTTDLEWAKRLYHACLVDAAQEAKSFDESMAKNRKARGLDPYISLNEVLSRAMEEKELLDNPMFNEALLANLKKTDQIMEESRQIAEGENLSEEERNLLKNMSESESFERSMSLPPEVISYNVVGTSRDLFLDLMEESVAKIKDTKTEEGRLHSKDVVTGIAELRQKIYSSQEETTPGVEQGEVQAENKPSLTYKFMQPKKERKYKNY